MSKEHTGNQFFPEYRPLIEIDINSPEYQEYLAANRQQELDREEFGYIRDETRTRYMRAVEELDRLARRTQPGGNGSCN